MRVSILLACGLLLLVQGLPSQAERERPKFSDYSVKKIYRGQPTRPIITKDFREIRTRIRRGADSDVEFAGHYTVPRWGCGTSCNAFVIVDSISGRVYDGFGWLNSILSGWKNTGARR